MNERTEQFYDALMSAGKGEPWEDSANKPEPLPSNRHERRRRAAELRRLQKAIGRPTLRGLK